MSLQEYISEQFVGQDKSKQQILDEIYKAAKDAWYDKLKYIPLKPMALITVHNPGSSIIESIGFSEPNDIILNNFGIAFAGNFNNGAVVVSLTDVFGVADDYRINSSNNIYNARDNNPNTEAIGTQMQLGLGGGSFVRSNIALNNPFVSAPESNRFNTGEGGWLTGTQQVVVNGLLSNVTSTDTVGECGLFGLWRNDSAAGAAQNVFIIMLSHDIAAASFVSGQNINTTYTWSIT